MESHLRKILSKELRERHGYGMMEGKIKPVHIANSLMREEHNLVGRMTSLRHLMSATSSRDKSENLDAVRKMLERNRERWGRLGDEEHLQQSALATRVLPLLRKLLATDGAAFGSSPEFSSFSSPSVLTTTGDISDERAGAFIHRLWSGKTRDERLDILDILHELTAPTKSLQETDDLAAVLLPLAHDCREYRPTADAGKDLNERTLSETELQLREAAKDLATFERTVRPNPIASLQRIILLASLTLFTHAATRAHDWCGEERPVLLIDAGNERGSTVSTVSTYLVNRVMLSARKYLASILNAKFSELNSEWWKSPFEPIVLALRDSSKPVSQTIQTMLQEILEEFSDTETDNRTAIPNRLTDELNASGGRSLDGFLRLLGVRTGLLYPQQKITQKRVVPLDRTLETLVLSTFDITGKPLEYHDFLESLYNRWRLIVGGRPEDAALLSDLHAPIPSAELEENSQRFLIKLQNLGLARPLADTVAVVGLLEES